MLKPNPTIWLFCFELKFVTFYQNKWVMWRRLFLFFVLVVVQSCAKKTYVQKQLWPVGIASATEKIYGIENNQRKLLQTKEMRFTKKGDIEYAKTVDSLGNLIQETQKKFWFVVEKFPDREPCYCKTRWKPKQRERISCYTQKQFKQTESIYFYNKDGSVAKIVDNFTNFNTQYFYYTQKELTKIVIKDKSGKLIDEIFVSCLAKDEKGVCLNSVRNATLTHQKIEINLSISYD